MGMCHWCRCLVNRDFDLRKVITYAMTHLILVPFSELFESSKCTIKVTFPQRFTTVPSIHFTGVSFEKYVHTQDHQ